ncbi:hypothetical protein D3C80_1378200 [compost metagenome]
MRVQRHALGLGCSLGGGQGHGEDRVGAQNGLVLGTVQLDHRLIQRFLLDRVLAQQQLADRAVDVGHGLQHALAQITALVAITQFQRLARTGGSTGRRAGAADDAVVEDHVGFYGRVTAGIQDLTAFDVDDFCHCW